MMFPSVFINTARNKIILAALASAMLAACDKSGQLAYQAAPADYRARHPIALSEKPREVDIFLAGGALDEQARAKVREVGREYAHAGSGPVSLHVPAPLAQDPRVTAIVDGVRRELAAGGARGTVSISTYQVADPRLASPLRLSYRTVQASLTKPCGEWPGDLASGSNVSGWSNKPYWNHGCAYQQMFVAQVSDPRDLAGPRAESPADVAMRTRAIKNVRDGADPGTNWRVGVTAAGGGAGGSQ